MNETVNKENEYVGYEYKDVTVKCSMESVYVDGYANFGWIVPYLFYRRISGTKTGLL